MQSLFEPQTETSHDDIKPRSVDLNDNATTDEEIEEAPVPGAWHDLSEHDKAVKLKYASQDWDDPPPGWEFDSTIPEPPYNHKPLAQLMGDVRKQIEKVGPYLTPAEAEQLERLCEKVDSTRTHVDYLRLRDALLCALEYADSKVREKEGH